MTKRSRQHRPLRWIAAPLLAVLAASALFVRNGTDPGWRVPEFGVLGPALENVPAELRVLAFNLAKAGFYANGLKFASEEEVRARLDTVAETILAEDVHVAFLSEIVWEAGPCPVNQVKYLAERTEMHAYAYGDNYRFGLPFYRVRSGNAVLSRLPLRPVRVQQLAGASPFWQPTGNRRVLWCELDLGGEALRVASVRNDSFDLANNAVQAQQLLAELGDEAALLAGDFNAEPHDRSMCELFAVGRFLPHGSGTPTFPTRAPRRLIDYVLAPAHWTQVDYRVLDSEASDHLPVLAVYETKPKPR